MTNRLKILSLFAILLALLLLAFFSYFFTQINKAQSSASVPVRVSIEKGMSARQAARLLAKEKLVNHAWIFSWYVYGKGMANKIQAGEYQLDRKMSVVEIVQIVTAGKAIRDEYKVTIIEGWTNRDIAANLEKRNIASALEFNAIAAGHEGYLFPDTYSIGKKGAASELIDKMLKNFEKKTEDLKVTKDAIILASIIEKEVGRTKTNITEDDLADMQKERELVASVFYNRLARGMALQSDATVNYITGKSDRQVSLADAKVKSPYNTYLNRGLPPAPISNPGLGSIKAAIYASDSDYLYFLNTTSGEAVFAKTVEEHNANKAKFLK